MADWLLKTEPGEYAYKDLVEAGRDIWDGVKNNLALKHMRTMQPGDRALIYHTGKERRIVGIAEVTSAPYPDPELDNEKLVVVDLEPREALPRPVTLAEIKKDDRFADFDLVRLSRLSVVPVSPQQWQWLLEMGGIERENAKKIT